jgi:hypothetical protein
MSQVVDEYSGIVHERAERTRESVFRQRGLESERRAASRHCSARAALQVRCSSCARITSVWITSSRWSITVSVAIPRADSPGDAER